MGRLDQVWESRSDAARVLVTVALIALIILVSPDCRVTARTRDSDLIRELRAPLCSEYVGSQGCLGGFGVSQNQATDAELREFLSDQENRLFIEKMVSLNRVGQNVHRFVYERKRYSSGEINAEKEFISSILVDTTFAIIQEVARSAGMQYLSGTLHVLSVLNTLLGGRIAVANFVGTVASSSSMSVIHSEYFSARSAGRSAASAFSDIYGTYEPLIDQSLNLMALRVLDEQRQRDVGQQFFETRYQAWKFATSKSRREEIRDLVVQQVEPPTPTTSSVSGRVTSMGVGLQGVRITLAASPYQRSTVITDGNGYYSFRGLVGGIYTITAERTGMLFTPPSRQTAVYGDVAGQDFTASGTGVSSAPSLRIDGRTSSQRRQLETFSFVGTGLTRGVTAVQNIQHPDGTVQQYSAVVPSSGTLAWKYTAPCTAPTGTYTVWVEDPYVGSSNRVTETIIANSACDQARPDLPPTATVLVMDVSGSMGYTWKGGVKIDSAKDAALQFINHVEQENLTQGTEHWIGVVGFSSDAHLILPLTSNYARARDAVISLHATNATNLGAGLLMGLEQVSSLGGGVQRYVTILSDGNTNAGLSKDEILSGPVVQARRANICLNTVAFGDRNDVDEDFLRRIASPLLGCGRYEYAATGFDLFAAYIKIRHHALGQVISGLSSFGRSVTPLVGRTIPLGTISIPSGQKELQITLGWSERGTLQLKLRDPSGREVTSSYPGARLYSSAQFAQAIVTSPQTGLWRVEALPATSMPQGTQYFAVGSTRPGGIAFALPLPVFTVGDRTFALPGNMPTWALVLVSVVCIAFGLWQLLSEAGYL